jgi:hypothetical protein
VRNLKREFTGVTQHQHLHTAFLGFSSSSSCVTIGSCRSRSDWRIQLMQRRETKDGRLSHTRLGLTNNISTEHSLRNTFVLHFRRMFKSGIDNRSQQFRFQQKVFKAGRVNANVVTLFARFFGACCCASVRVFDIVDLL